jgi:nitronate monooxygenase
VFGVEHPVVQGGMHPDDRVGWLRRRPRPGGRAGAELIFRPLRNTARVASNAVSREVVEILNRGGEFSDVKHLVAGVRGVKVFENGDLDAGIWSVGTAMGLINDIPTVGELVSRIVEEAEELITGRLGDMVAPDAVENVA